MNATDLITCSAGIETPIAGRWTIPPVTITARVGSRRLRYRLPLCVAGTLDLTQDPPAGTISLTTGDSGLLRPVTFEYRGTIIDEDRFGRWRVEGTAGTYGEQYDLDLLVGYQGVYRAGPGGLVWLSILGAGVGPATSRRLRLIRDLNGEINAITPTAPDQQSSAPRAMAT